MHLFSTILLKKKKEVTIMKIDDSVQLCVLPWINIFFIFIFFLIFTHYVCYKYHDIVLLHGCENNII